MTHYDQEAKKKSPRTHPSGSVHQLADKDRDETDHSVLEGSVKARAAEGFPLLISVKLQWTWRCGRPGEDKRAQ